MLYENGRSESDVPRLEDEFHYTMRDIVAGNDPRTVTHALLREGRPLTQLDIAAIIGQPAYEIDGVIATLEASGWIMRINENKLEKLSLTVPLIKPESQVRSL